MSKKSNGKLAVAISVDMSGSMSGIRDDTIEAVNDYIAGLAKQEGETLLTLTVWDTEGIENICVATPIEDAPRLNADNYTPRSGTPLFDAIAKAANDTDQRMKENGTDDEWKALVTVFSDGYENSSKEFPKDPQTGSNADLVALVKRYEDTGKWTFIYLGAGHANLADAQKYAQGMGYSPDNAMIFAKTETSMKATGQSLTGATQTYREAAGSTAAFFSDSGQTTASYIPEDKTIPETKTRETESGIIVVEEGEEEEK